MPVLPVKIKPAARALFDKNRDLLQYLYACKSIIWYYAPIIELNMISIITFRFNQFESSENCKWGNTLM